MTVAVAVLDVDSPSPAAATPGPAVEPRGRGHAAYPLDGYERTGIRRLRAYAKIQSGELDGPPLPPGATLSVDDIELRLLTEGSGFDVNAGTPVDPELQAGLEEIFADRPPSYSVAVVDITDPASPRFAALEEDRAYLPGSVGKILVMTGLFDALQRAWPAPDDRLRLLRETVVTADRFALPDSHTVPVVKVHPLALAHNPIRVGDRFSLFEWIDHMVSPSSNGAGSTVWKEAMLLRRFGRSYPAGPWAEELFLRDASGSDLRDLALATVEDPLRKVGLDVDELRIGTMFTDGGRAVVPGVRSLASPRQLVRWLLRLEQGRLVDRWSSLEMKRLLYFTRNRYRYAVSPALREAAVYFKSGSFYRCEPEPGFECGKYRGNHTNLMNSVAIVESPARPAPDEPQRAYLVAMMSNVLRTNSAREHAAIAGEIERLIARLNDR